MVKFYEVLMELCQELIEVWKSDRSIRAVIDEVFSVEGLKSDDTDDLTVPGWADRIFDNLDMFYKRCMEALKSRRVGNAIGVYFIYRQACNTYMMLWYLAKSIEQVFDFEMINELTNFIEQSKDIKLLANRIEGLSNTDKVIFISYLNQY